MAEKKKIQPKAASSETARGKTAAAGVEKKSQKFIARKVTPKTVGR